MYLYLTSASGPNKDKKVEKGGKTLVAALMQKNQHLHRLVQMCTASSQRRLFPGSCFFDTLFSWVLFRSLLEATSVPKLKINCVPATSLSLLTMRNESSHFLSPKNPLILSLVSLSFLLLVPAAAQSPAYTPTENITLNCGYSGVQHAQDGRIWTGDVGDSKHFLLELDKNNVSETSTADQQSRSGDQIPYNTARISLSQFTYTVPNLTVGNKFVRLHFYPASYSQSKFDRSRAFFSVKANQYTLLSNFSAALTVDSDPNNPPYACMFREFCVTVEQDKGLNITFIPSNPDSYTFINGIEIVSMPSNLYYSPPESVKFINSPQSGFPIENTTALELVYRLNVGGSSISPQNDSGMYRTWSPDNTYLNEKIGVVPVNLTTQLKYTSVHAVQPYTAPAEVYRTARSMGTNKTENKSYNLTWVLPVNSGFNYLVRLHFCECMQDIRKDSDREFTIFIADQIAELQADVITWAVGENVPVYKDYVVLIPDKGSERKFNLSVALHPNADSRTRYSDAILNGIELFKLNKSDGSLAAPNPIPPPSASPSAPVSSKHNNNKRGKIVAATCATLIGAVAVSLFLYILFHRRAKKVKDSASTDGGSSWWAAFSHSTITSMKATAARLPSDLCRRFSLSQIRAATNDFDGVLIVGVGGFGDVYKGCINDGATAVAIKRLKPGSRQGAHEFQTEIEMLSQLRHVHLVSLIGYCNDDGEMILVYDYMHRGTLRDHLYNTDNPPIPWKQRLQICIGAARGLHYLHAGAKHTIIHRDVKSTNILLDEKWVAKVSDFGLSKIGPTNLPNAHVSTVVKGSFGYMDPEYFRRQQLTAKSDVYSFGVVLLEVLCARPALNQTLSKDQVSLAEWARICYRQGTLDQIVDPNLDGQIVRGCLKVYGEIAVSCLKDEGIERPSMSDVVGSLEFALQLQESAEVDAGVEFSDDVFSSSTGRVSISKASWMTIGSGDGQSSSVAMTSESSEKLISGAVFSEILNPQGR